MTTTLWFHSLWGDRALVLIAIWFAQGGILLTGLALIGAAWRRRREWRLLVPFAIGAFACFVLDLLAGWAYHEPRPFVTLRLLPLVAYDPADNSFPSDHAAVTAYVAGFLAFVDRPWAIVAACAALLVGLARVFCLLHWQQDVLAGWAIGLAPGIAAGLAAARLLHHARR